MHRERREEVATKTLRQKETQSLSAPSRLCVLAATIPHPTNPINPTKSRFRQER
jgi:hypothetical protein